MKRLSLADWGHVAEIFGAVAVVVSLAYVGIQLKQNTEAIQAQTQQQVMSNYADYQVAIIGQEAMAPLMIKAEEGEALTPEEELKLSTWAHLLLSNWETTYLSYQNGLLGEEAWQGWEKYFIASMNDVYVRDAWVNNPIDGYGRRFTEYVNEEVLGEGEP